MGKKRHILVDTQGLLMHAMVQPRIGNASTARRSTSSASPPSASCCESSAIAHNVSGQTLRTSDRHVSLPQNATPTSGATGAQTKSGRDTSASTQLWSEFRSKCVRTHLAVDVATIAHRVRRILICVNRPRDVTSASTLAMVGDRLGGLQAAKDRPLASTQTQDIGDQVAPIPFGQDRVRHGRVRRPQAYLQGLCRWSTASPRWPKTTEPSATCARDSLPLRLP